MAKARGIIAKKRYTSAEARRPLDGSVFALFGILILCFGAGIFIHMLIDRIAPFPSLEWDTSHLAEGSNSFNKDWFESESIKRVISVIDTYNKDMHPQLKRDVAHEVYGMAIKYPNLDVELICSVITYASRKTWDPRILSSTGSLGLMQVRPAIGKFFARYEGIEWTTGEEILFNPIYNIRIGARYLSTLIGRYGLEDGLAVYLMGQKERKWGGKIHNGVYYRRLEKPSQGVRDGKTA